MMGRHTGTNRLRGCAGLPLLMVVVAVLTSTCSRDPVPQKIVNSAASASLTSEPSRRNQLDSLRRYYQIVEGRDILPIYPITESDAPTAWYYYVRWDGGRVVEYDKINPAGSVNEITTIELRAGGSRVLRKKNAYGVEVYIDVLDNTAAITRTLRSGEVVLEGCYRKQRQYDALGRIETERCLDDKNNAIMGESGCFVVRYGWSENADLLSKACLQDDMTPLTDAGGIHRTVYKRDLRGALVEESYYAISGERISRTIDGCARVQFLRDASGNATEATCIGAGGLPAQVRGSSYASTKEAFDRNGCVIERTYANAEGRPAAKRGIAKSSYRVDEWCGVLSEEHRDSSDRLVPPEPRQSAAVEQELNTEGLVTTRRCRGPNGPTSCYDAENGSRGALKKMTYDERGRVVREQWFAADGKPSRRADAYPHQSNLDYGPDGRAFAETFMDEVGKPALGLGVARMERRYNVVGKETSYRFFDRNGSPAAGILGVATVKYQYDPQQRLISVELEDATGAPKWTSGMVLGGVTWSNGASRMTVERSSGGGLANLFYGPDGKLVTRVDCAALEMSCYRK